MQKSARAKRWIGPSRRFPARSARRTGKRDRADPVEPSAPAGSRARTRPAGGGPAGCGRCPRPLSCSALRTRPASGRPAGRHGPLPGTRPAGNGRDPRMPRPCGPDRQGSPAHRRCGDGRFFLQAAWAPARRDHRAFRASSVARTSPVSVAIRRRGKHRGRRAAGLSDPGQTGRVGRADPALRGCDDTCPCRPRDDADKGRQGSRVRPADLHVRAAEPRHPDAASPGPDRRVREQSVQDGAEKHRHRVRANNSSARGKSNLPATINANMIEAGPRGPDPRPRSRSAASRPCGRSPRQRRLSGGAGRRAFAPVRPVRGHG